MLSVEDKFKRPPRAEFNKRHWGLGTHSGNVLEWPWCVERGSVRKPGVHGVHSRALGLCGGGAERSLGVCGGAGHCTPREAKTNPDPDLRQAKQRLGRGFQSADGAHPLHASLRQRERQALRQLHLSSSQPTGSVQRLHAAPSCVCAGRRGGTGMWGPDISGWGKEVKI